ncbi:MAG TPA: hypothetical protein VGP40_04615 [Chthoniobacterales bacterium]|nr:hypothetical protein [Chthoniobacterales bacterium]
MKRFLLVVVLAAAAAFAVWFGMRSRVLSASSNAAISALLPKETLALVHLPDFNRAREEWRRTDIYQLWREPALQDFLQKPLANVAMSDRVKQNLQEIETIGMRDAFVALTAVRDGRPEIAGGFHFDGTSSAAERVIGKWRRALQRRFPDLAYSVVTHEGHELQLMTREGNTVATAYAGQWFLAANDVELLKSLLDRVDERLQEAPATLRTDERYAAAFKHMPMGYALFVYGRLDKYIETLAARTPEAAANPQFDVLRQIQSVAAATTFESGKMHDVLFVGMPKRADEGELTRSSLTLATDNSFLYSAALLHLPKEIPMPNATNATATSWIAKFQQKMTALGATGFTMEEFNSAFVPEATVIGDWPENTRIPALFFSLPVRDMEKANGIVAAVTAVADEDRPWTRSSKDGVQYYTLPPANPMIPVSPTIAVDKNLLVVGVDPVSVESAMTRGSDGGAGLAATSEFKTAEALVPKPAQSFIFVDTALLYGRLDAAVRPMLVMAAAFMPGIANKVDLGKFPPPDVITRHLSPIVVSQNYRNDGYVTESVGPISVYQAVLGIAGASGAGADFYQGQTGSGIPGGIAAPTTPNVSSSPTATVAPPPPAGEESDESPPEP